MRIHLKVKYASLAEEAKIIRRLERKALKRARRVKAWSEQYPLTNDAKVFQSLRCHRKEVVRPEARSTHLAYGFLRGRDYKQIESKCYNQPDWPRIEKLIEKYGEGDKRDLMQRFSEWKSE